MLGVAGVTLGLKEGLELNLMGFTAGLALWPPAIKLPGIGADRNRERRMTREIVHYTDLKSPYAYLAVEATRGLERDFDVHIDWRPYSLQIDNFMGSVAERSEHQWRKVKYSYMDCRRIANTRGLTLRGPKKIYDTRMANTGLLYAKAAGPEVLAAYVDRVFEGFFCHTIEVEEQAQIEAALNEAGADAGGFRTYLDGDGGAEHGPPSRGSGGAGRLRRTVLYARRRTLLGRRPPAGLTPPSRTGRLGAITRIELPRHRQPLSPQFEARRPDSRGREPAEGASIPLVYQHD